MMEELEFKSMEEIEFQEFLDHEDDFFTRLAGLVGPRDLAQAIIIQYNEFQNARGLQWKRCAEGLSGDFADQPTPDEIWAELKHQDRKARAVAAQDGKTLYEIEKIMSPDGEKEGK